MARIAGIDLPRTKRIEIGLTYIYGIGRKRSNDILTAAGVSADIRIKDLSEDDVRKISRVIEEQGRVEGDLRKEDLDEHQAADGNRQLARACATAATCRCAASAPRPTRARARARARAPIAKKKTV